jgi:hypothetical protein
LAATPTSFSSATHVRDFSPTDKSA